MERKFFALAGKTEMPCCSVAGDSHLDPCHLDPWTFVASASAKLGILVRMGQPPDS